MNFAVVPRGGRACEGGGPSYPAGSDEDCNGLKWAVPLPGCPSSAGSAFSWQRCSCSTLASAAPSPLRAPIGGSWRQGIQVGRRSGSLERYLPLVASLPARGVIGYLQPDDWPSAGAQLRFYLAEYSLTPRVVVMATTPDYVIVTLKASVEGDDSGTVSRDSAPCGLRAAQTIRQRAARLQAKQVMVGALFAGLATLLPSLGMYLCLTRLWHRPDAPPTRVLAAAVAPGLAIGVASFFYFGLLHLASNHQTAMRLDVGLWLVIDVCLLLDARRRQNAVSPLPDAKARDATAATSSMFCPPGKAFWVRRLGLPDPFGVGCLVVLAALHRQARRENGTHSRSGISARARSPGPRPTGVRYFPRICPLVATEIRCCLPLGRSRASGLYAGSESTCDADCPGPVVLHLVGCR